MNGKAANSFQIGYTYMCYNACYPSSMSVSACLSSDNEGFHGPQKGGLNSFDVQFLVSHRQVNTQQVLFAEVARVVLKIPPNYQEKTS